MLTRLSQPLLATCCSFLDWKDHLTGLAPTSKQCLAAAQLGSYWSGTDVYNDTFMRRFKVPEHLECLAKKYKFRIGEINEYLWSTNINLYLTQLPWLLPNSVSTLRRVNMRCFSMKNDDKCIQLNQLVAEYSSNVTDLNLSYLDAGPYLRHAPNLRRLCLGWTQFDTQLLRGCPQLAELNLGSCDNTDLTVLQELPSLTDLHLPRGVTDATLTAIKRLTQLQTLGLTDGRQVTPAAWKDTLQPLVKLVNVSLSNVQVEHVEVLQNIPLRELTISVSDTMDPGKSLEAAAGIATLRSLDLYCSDSEYDYKRPEFTVEQLMALDKLTQLQSLSLGNVGTADDTYCEFLARSKVVPQLTKLDIGLCFKPAMLWILVARQAEVETLDITGISAHNPNWSSVFAAFKLLPKLRTVYIFSYQYDGDVSFRTELSNLITELPHIDFKF